MTSSKDLNSIRPTNPHRLSISSTATSIPARQSHSRTHSHSTSLGTLNATHRVTRRKSMSLAATTNNTAAAAIAAVVKGTPTVGSRMGFSSKPAQNGSYPSPPSSLPGHAATLAQSQANLLTSRTSSAVVDGPLLSSMAEIERQKAKIRRASEGSRLAGGKGEGKRMTNGELKCEKCGKGYKHSSCLTKHLWEHTPEWAITSKLLISKHQQVQLLEAASVLVAMNQDGLVEASNGPGSDHSSASPAASGSSGPHDDDMSSVDTTPPPQAEDVYVGSYTSQGNAYGRNKRLSSNSSAYSRSYQSAFSSDNVSSHHRQWSTDHRPSTSGTSVTNYDDEDQGDLAAAVGLLSCSFGTPKSGPITLAADVPPVPPLPAKYLGANASGLSGSTVTPTQPQASLVSNSYSSYGENSRDVDMDEDDESEDEDEDGYARSATARKHSDDEDMVFGTMEE